MRYSNGNLTYEVVEGWGKLPAGWDLVEVPGVAMDSQDRVYAFNRGEHPMVVFDRDGNFLTSWGEGVFKRAHGVCIGPDDAVYCVDDADHTLRKCTPEGKVLMTIGVPGRASDTGYVDGDFLSVKHGGPPFHRPTNVALSPEGDIYVSDGYGNARVHKFSPEGKLLQSWGEPGSGPGQFRLVHGIFVDGNGTVYVGDRMNSRVQLFSPSGEYLGEWNDVYQPDDLFIDGEGLVYIPELGYNANLPMSRPVPVPEQSYPRVTVRNRHGEVLLGLAGPDPRAPGSFLAPHAARVDSRGDLYVGEVSATNARKQGWDYREFHPLQKFARARV
ncbi:MAG: peptidyl-alpha-hydroxyglycine alpha-amidating lyase family protein [Dehalococcoidales bacterium]|nr:peptidyl-alpha-hydroxyglycine alpha-amidating lyase family protein [Dehalococcoidales bacterium]